MVLRELRDVLRKRIGLPPGTVNEIEASCGMLNLDTHVLRGALADELTRRERELLGREPWSRFDKKVLRERFKNWKPARSHSPGRSDAFPGPLDPDRVVVARSHPLRQRPSWRQPPLHRTGIV